MYKTLSILLAAGVIILASAGELKAEELSQIKTALHLSSDISGGSLRLADIARTCRENNISAVILTDRAMLKWEYGAWPLRNLIKEKFEEPSIFTFGIENYLEEVDKLKEAYPDMVFTAGTEVAPFYYWQGSPLKDDLTMYDWHKHILAFGLRDADDYRGLPFVGNPGGLRTTFSVVLLWPFLTLLAGLFLLGKKKYSYRDSAGRSLGPASPFWRITGLSILFVSLLFIVNNWPFFSLRFDQYQTDRGDRPYQDFIDYVHEKGGLTFWVSPEIEYRAKTDKVRLITSKSIDQLRSTRGYTGFCIFPYGYKEVGKPGGVWDELLVDYCRGKRADPVWTIGGLSFEKGDLQSAAARTQTVVLAEKKDAGSILKALREGRMYAVDGKDSLMFSLDAFDVYDESLAVKGTIGDRLAIDGKVLLHIEGTCEGEQKELEVRLIKNGMVIKTSRLQAPFVISYCDVKGVDERSYYRLDIQGEDVRAVTNPIFVKRE